MSTRWFKLANEYLGTDFKIEGLSKLENHAGLTVSQQFMRGSNPTLEELEAELKSQGFVKLKWNNILNRHVEDKTWYNADDSILLADVKPDNFIKTDSGKIVPIDPVIVKVIPGSMLARLCNLIWT